MKANVNEDCIGCGLCESICPQVFQMNGDRSVVVGDSDTYHDQAVEAASACPVNAIELD